MKTLKTPLDFSLYPSVIKDVMLDIRMRLGMSELIMYTRTAVKNDNVTLFVDVYNKQGRLYPMSFRLPDDVYHRTRRRLSLLISQLQRCLSEPE